MSSGQSLSLSALQVGAACSGCVVMPTSPLGQGGLACAEHAEERRGGAGSGALGKGRVRGISVSLEEAWVMTESQKATITWLLLAQEPKVSCSYIY